MNYATTHHYPHRHKDCCYDNHSTPPTTFHFTPILPVYCCIRLISETPWHWKHFMSNYIIIYISKLDIHTTTTTTCSDSCIEVIHVNKHWMCAAIKTLMQHSGYLDVPISVVTGGEVPGELQCSVAILLLCTQQKPVLVGINRREGTTNSKPVLQCEAWSEPICLTVWLLILLQELYSIHPSILPVSL